MASRVIRKVFLLGGYPSLHRKFIAQFKSLGIEVGGVSLTPTSRLSAAGTWSSYDAFMVFVDVASHALTLEANGLAKKLDVPVFKLTQSWVRSIKILEEDPLWNPPTLNENKEALMTMTTEEFYSTYVRPIFEPSLKEQRVLAYSKVCQEVLADLPPHLKMTLTDITQHFPISRYKEALDNFYTKKMSPPSPPVAKVVAPAPKPVPLIEELSKLEAQEKEFEAALEILLSEHPNLLLTDKLNQISCTLAVMGIPTPITVAPEWEDFFLETWTVLQKKWKNKNPLHLWDMISKSQPKPKDFLWDEANQQKVFEKISTAQVFETFVKPTLSVEDTAMHLSIVDKRGILWYETWKQQRVAAHELIELWGKHNLLAGAPLHNEAKMRTLIQQIIFGMQADKFVISKFPRDRPQYKHTTYSMTDIPGKFKAAWVKVVAQVHQEAPASVSVAEMILATTIQEDPMDNVGGEIVLKKNILENPAIPASNPFALQLKEGIMGMIFENGMPLKDAIEFPPDISLLGDGSGALIYRPKEGIASLLALGEGLEVKGDRLFLTKENYQVRKLIRKMGELGLEAAAILAACQASQHTFRGQPVTLDIVVEVLSA